MKHRLCYQICEVIYFKWLKGGGSFYEKELISILLLGVMALGLTTGCGDNTKTDIFCTQEYYDVTANVYTYLNDGKVAHMDV